MSIEDNDPRLTAYVFGELDAEELAAFEAELETSAEARHAVNEIREVAQVLKAELATEPIAGLTADRRQVIDHQIDQVSNQSNNSANEVRFPWRFVWLSTGLAASLLLTLAVLRASRLSLSARKDVASPPAAHVSIMDAAVPDAAAPGSSQLDVLKVRGQTPDPAQQLAANGRDVDNYVDLLSKPTVTNYTPGNLGTSLVNIGGGKNTIGETNIQSRSGSGLALWRVNVAADGTGNFYRFDPGAPILSREAYDHIEGNAYHIVLDNPLSTFSIDVDTASYSNIRRFLTSGQLPPMDAVRIEEMINYFAYDYPQPEGDQPFSVNVEVADCPWNPLHRLAKIGLKGYEIQKDERPPSNLVFLVDVSGSMNTSNKLPLVQQSLRKLLDQLDESDRVALVVYAGASGMVLDSTPCDDRKTLADAVDNLRAGGSTNGGAGIELAYKIAQENFITDGVNRVILATDGDFNVGITDRGSLIRLIEEKAKTGVFLSVLGFGMGNLNDATLEKLADKGNGNYAYIDTLAEAQKVLIEQMGGTLITIAKDVKIQVEFNPAVAAAYRLIGYENRMLADRDFNDDTKDAGEIGAGHTVTALYEIVPAGVESAEVAGLPSIDPLKYQTNTTTPSGSDELMTVKLRYKPHDGDVSKLLEVPVGDEGHTLDEASADFHFAASVASFGMLLRGSEYIGDFGFQNVLELAESGNSERDDYRMEFVTLVERAHTLKGE